MVTPDPFQYLKQAEIIHSELAVSHAISTIATKLNQDYANKQPVVLSVMSGALFFTGQLLPKLLFPLEVDYVHATRYRGELSGNTVEWIVRPTSEVEDRNVLILDDILDEGITLKAIVDQCILLGAREVKIAVLAEKNINKSKPISADYVELTLPNRYVFGCGMDVHNWWRNLPAIYALHNE
jgi:hypoxanthine phosphoribosyltransferase